MRFLTAAKTYTDQELINYEQNEYWNMSEYRRSDVFDNYRINKL